MGMGVALPARPARRVGVAGSPILPDQRTGMLYCAASARDTLDLFAWISAKQPLENLTGRYFARAAELVEAGFITPEGEITQRGLNWAEDRDERAGYERALEASEAGGRNV